MQPLPAPTGHHQHVCHHLLPTGPRQVRLPPGLPLQVLPAQLRRRILGQGQTPSVSTWTSSSSIWDQAASSKFKELKMDHYISCLEPKFPFYTRELHYEVVTTRPKTSATQRMSRLSPVTEVCVDSVLCFRTLCIRFSVYHCCLAFPKQQ